MTISDLLFIAWLTVSFGVAVKLIMRAVNAILREDE